MRTSLLLIPMLALMASSCPKSSVLKDEVPTSIYCPVVFKANNTQVFKNETFSIDNGRALVNLATCNIYLSNIKLIRADGSLWAEKDSYHLVRLGNQNGNEGAFSITGIPKDTYKSIEFSFGIDSLHNRKMDQIGDLDPANGMAWDWNTGYRYLVMEGSYQLISGGVGTKPLVWHIGTASNYRTKRSALNNFQTEGASIIKFEIDIEKFFSGIHVLPIENAEEIMFQRDTTALAADNILQAISVNSY